MPKTEAVFLMPDLKGPDGNAFALLARASNSLKDSGYGKETRDEFRTEATSGNYEHLLETIMTWFIVVAARTEYERIN